MGNSVRRRIRRIQKIRTVFPGRLTDKPLDFAPLQSDKGCGRARAETVGNMNINNKGFHSQSDAATRPYGIFGLLITQTSQYLL